MAAKRTRPGPAATWTSMESPSFTRVTTAGTPSWIGGSAAKAAQAPNPARISRLTTSWRARRTRGCGSLLGGCQFQGLVFMRTVYHIRANLFTVFR